MADTDNLYPASTAWLPTESQDQKNDRETEKAEVYNALPLITKMITHFAERIAFYSSVDSIPVETQAKPDEFMHSVIANKLIKANLEAEKSYLESLLDDIK